MTPSSLTAAQFVKWRLGHGWSRSFAARTLGISVSSVGDYERGKRSDSGGVVKIPKVVALAMSAVDGKLEAYRG